jgi:hypothetical protein
MTLTKVHNFFKPQFPLLHEGDNIDFTGGVWITTPYQGKPCGSSEEQLESSFYYYWVAEHCVWHLASAQ